MLGIASRILYTRKPGGHLPSPYFLLQTSFPKKVTKTGNSRRVLPHSFEEQLFRREENNEHKGEYNGLLYKPFT